MKSLINYINEWKEDMGRQIVLIMGTPGCGKTYWMQHSGIAFFRKLGITMNPKELDIDHTLKCFQLLDFPNFCERVINYKSTVISDNKGDVHNKDKAWKTFIDNEQERYKKLNEENGGLVTNIPDLSKIDYKFVAPWLTRYENAKDSAQPKVFDEFVIAMKHEYFDKVFASDFSVRDEAKEEYDENMFMKLKSNSDVFIAISGAKLKPILKTIKLAKGDTVSIVYLNGSVDKAVGQDAKRDRSGGEEFVRSYAAKITEVWDMLTGDSESNYKKLGIYKMYEFIDAKANDIASYPVWKLSNTYK